MNSDTVAEYDVFLYFSGNMDEKSVWDSEFSYYLGLLLFQIMDYHPRMISNANVPGTVYMDGNSPIGLNKLKGFVFITGQEDIQQIYALRQFIDKMSPDQKNRIMVVRRPQRKIEPLIDSLLGMPVYEFYERNKYTREIVEFNATNKDSRNAYWERLTDLAYDLKFFLMESELTEISIKRVNTIFLAEVSPDQIKNRNLIKRELILSGYHVLPRHPLPADLNGFENKVVEDLEKSILSIQILGESYGDSPENTDYSYPEIQNRLFTDVAKRQQNYKDVDPKIGRIIWVPSNSEPFEEKQIQFLKRIKKEILISPNSEFLQSNVHDLKEIIDHKITSIKHSAGKEMETTSDLLLIADDYRDIACVVVKEEASHSALHLTSLKNLAGVQNIEKMMNELKKYKNVLILNTKNDRNWLYSVLNLLAKSKGYANAVFPVRIGLFSPNQVKEVPHLNMFDLELFTYSSRNISNLLQSFILKLSL